MTKEEFLKAAARSCQPTHGYGLRWKSKRTSAKSYWTHSENGGCPMLRPPETPMMEYLHGLICPVIPNCAAISYQSEGPLPDEFSVYYLVSATPEGYFNGKPRRVKERYSVTCYERDKRNLEPKAAQMKAAMLAGGFLYAATSADRYAPDTEHWARTLDFRYYEESEG